MPETRLYLFGAPRLEVQGQPVVIDTRKALALLAYVLIENQPQSRDTLATLLWPESDQSAARAALRRTLSPLRRALSADLIDFGRELIAIHPGDDFWCDVIDFQARSAECRSHGHAEDQTCPRCLVPLQKAASLYQDDFMSGFSLRDSAAFDDWQFFETDRLRREFAAVLERLVAIQETQGDFSSAIEHAHRWLNLDPLNETAHRALIALYAKSDQRNAALRQYRQCVRILDQELGVPPLEETTSLYEAVKENRLEKQVDGDAFSARKNLAVNPQIRDQAPIVVDLSPLVGRTHEWETLTQLYGEITQDGLFAA
ncbi:MAG: BTAD domain-containing putative transcriptional regulator, partial [Anaerolineales bacterium]